jgi:deoxyribose-phosphate aldolase
MTRRELARYLDHTALKPETTEGQVRALCDEAHRDNFASVCVMPYHVPAAVRFLEELESTVPVCTAIGFPLGAHQTVVKVAEARKALHDGAFELDMVMNIGALKSNHPQVVLADIISMATTAHEAGAILKVILETSLLSDDEKRHACELAARAGADFVKTSTGFSGGGATVEDIQLMRATLPAQMRIKASGGIRDYATALAMIEAGADRIGASASVGICDGAEQ